MKLLLLAAVLGALCAGAQAAPPVPRLADGLKFDAAEMGRIVRQLGIDQKRAAALFGLKADELFPRVPSITIAPFELGSAGSFVFVSGEVLLTVYPDTRDEPLDDAVVLHELGHVISILGGPRIPPLLHAGLDSPLLVEAVADSLALELTGNTVNGGASVPACFSKFRPITAGESFDDPRGLFLADDVARRLQRCCVESEHDGTATPRSRAACKEVAGMEFPAFDSAPFDVAEYAATPANFDPHRLGVPLNSFLLDLRLRTGKSSLRRFWDALWTAPGLDSVFATMRAAASDTDRATWDQLWARHAMDKAQRMLEADAARARLK